MVLSVLYMLATWMPPLNSHRVPPEQTTQEEATSLVKVTILPPEVVKLGAKWRIDPEYPQLDLDPARRVDGGSWLNSNEPIRLTRNHRYKIEFSTVSGWQAPATQFIDSSGTAHLFSYIRLPVQPRSSDENSITEKMRPADAANPTDGGKVDGPGEKKHGGDKINLPDATSAPIISSDPSSRRKPSRIPVDTDGSSAIPLAPTYERISADSDSGTVPVSPDPVGHQADLGYLSTTIESRQAVQPDARLRIPRGEWQHSGAERGPRGCGLDMMCRQGVSCTLL